MSEREEFEKCYDSIPAITTTIQTAWLVWQAARAPLLERIKILEDRLEIDPRHSYDGIACRDETVRLQDKRIDELRAKVERLEVAVRQMLSLL
jgi:hypothetical protein